MIYSTKDTIAVGGTGTGHRGQGYGYQSCNCRGDLGGVGKIHYPSESEVAQGGPGISFCCGKSPGRDSDYPNPERELVFIG